MSSVNTYRNNKKVIFQNSNLAILLRKTIEVIGEFFVSKIWDYVPFSKNVRSNH
jgi:hypothetical protein